jgi:selenocysteine lyase/cysteine desulfurase
MIREVTREQVTYADAPMRFEAGTPPIVQTVGLAAALDYLDGIGRDRIAAHEMELSRVAARKLKDMNGVRIIGEAQDKGPIISFEAIGIHAHDLRHHSGPRRCRRPRRSSLRAAADGAVQRGGHGARVVWALQHNG